jgi:hypothetical protein
VEEELLYFLFLFEESGLADCEVVWGFRQRGDRRRRLSDGKVE